MRSRAHSARAQADAVAYGVAVDACRRLGIFLYTANFGLASTRSSCFDQANGPLQIDKLVSCWQICSLDSSFTELPMRNCPEQLLLRQADQLGQLHEPERFTR